MKMKVSSPDAAVEMTNRIFEVRDMILTILSSKEYEDIARPEDKLALKQELMTTLNRALQKGQIQDIYFTEFLVQ
jgi:flagellar FliL protein